MENFKVIREAYEKDGKQYYRYFIVGGAKGRNVKVYVAPPDIGGYGVLDIVFNGKNETALETDTFKFTNDKGNEVEATVFKAVSTDDTGEKYECNIKPSSKAAKSMLLKIMK